MYGGGGGVSDYVSDCQFVSFGTLPCFVCVINSVIMLLWQLGCKLNVFLFD